MNSDSSRITELQKLSSLHPKLIVFYNFDYELEQLRSLSGDAGRTSALEEKSPGMSHISSSVQIAEWNGHKHEPVD